MSTNKEERDLKRADDYLNRTNEPEPGQVTGPGAHFNDTFDPALRKNAPAAASGAGAQKSAQEKLANTDSTMTTAQLQAAAKEGDPNGLLGRKVNH
ncbi:hypothetical protein CLAFUW4_01367 [Fulvia fulva]|uniref:Uncharacterized protein n=1 Tax=Passalora fulva TaxID=5499 RepID=A0A9Q8L6F7_PASFU|nr:uncharacterized protein CLAFUR5_01370 [Fulvia fulva]KAK4635097.1 hypothetical protein CLAFUR4_01368 [Fulvia fulva]KAK4638186.1 hypothetical protein CLAFUR0_01369 [Fulvia fulva]UJO11725.1 hypothetical protein CLAFUR5_01370 [Fulvia fulva]WPV10257.1 hypothetical protein CLAFUW4_01367 [Fulvia fulva]WPV24307.1 hypothetical protein CLAFUW7_01372 [Fulvia fulva]